MTLSQNQESIERWTTNEQKRVRKQVNLPGMRPLGFDRHIMAPWKAPLKNVMTGII